VQILKDKNIEYEEIQYIKNPLSLNKLKEIASKLGLPPQKFIRKSDVKKLNLEINFENENEVLQHMVEYPRIIERPIIVNDEKAVIGRPPENILEII
tara:strand:- start:4355 stop:4645 length:291 start_codon:yes stop_codon:yes gene_type:complete